MSTLKILVVEDKIEDMNGLKEELMKSYSMLKTKELIKDSVVGFSEIDIEGIPGKEEGNDKFRPYDEEVIHTLINRAADIREQGHKPGILLDSVLNHSELEAIEMNDYSNIKLARTIMQKCEERDIPVFVVSSIGNFDTSSLSIMGCPMEDRYVQKSMILDYPNLKAIYKIFYYLGNGKPVNQEQLNQIFK